jgi:uncharacterized protein (DUF2252 family)
MAHPTRDNGIGGETHPHLSRDERKAAGKALRATCARESHSEINIASRGKRDVVAIGQASDGDRLQNLIPIRNGRMAQSPFAFFRGSAALQAFDLAGTQRSGIEVQACGDCHLSNFGGYATPERQLVFDINDFDETLPAPFEWDVKRLAASFVVAARSRSFTDASARAMAVEAARSYRVSMRDRANSGVLESWYSTVSLDDATRIIGKDSEALSRINKLVIKAQQQTSEHVFHKLTTSAEGHPRILDQPPLIFHAAGDGFSEADIEAFLSAYRETLPQERRMLFNRFQFVDVAYKVVGVGSVGTRCLIALLMAEADDPLFLQVKETKPSVLEPYTRKTSFKSNGERVVVGQRLMQAASDIFLGWSRGPEGRHFYVRQLRDMKISVDLETQPRATMHNYATLCGMTLARAHDKAGAGASVAGYLGKSDAFDEAIGNYAVAYADQVDRDYEAFVKGIRSGKVKTDLSTSELETAIR